MYAYEINDVVVVTFTDEVKELDAYNYIEKDTNKVVGRIAGLRVHNTSDRLSVSLYLEIHGTEFGIGYAKTIMVDTRYIKSIDKQVTDAERIHLLEEKEKEIAIHKDKIDSYALTIVTLRQENENLKDEIDELNSMMKMDKSIIESLTSQMKELGEQCKIEHQFSMYLMSILLESKLDDKLINDVKEYVVERGEDYGIDS